MLALLVALSCGALLATSTTVGISPFLLDIARDLHTDLTAAGNLVALQSVSWGAASVFAGAASDRLGRRPILIAGLLLLAASGVGVAVAGDYPTVAAWRLLGGTGGGSFMGTVFATVSDHVPPAHRGRSMGWVVTGQSFALVLGVPAMTLVGAALGWRGAVLSHAAALVLGATFVWLVVPHAPAHTRASPPPVGSTLRLIGPRVLALLLAGSAERVCYSVFAVFLPTFLLTRFAVEPAALAIGLGLVATGNLVGNVIGGQLTDRVPRPQLVVAGSLMACGLLAIPVLSWSPTVLVSVGLGFAYTLVTAASRPALLTLLSHVSPEARGAVLGLNITFSSLGWLSATVLGGYVLAVAGFGGLGLLTCFFAMAGALLSFAQWLWPRVERAPLVVAAGER
ncbi:MAG: MFS transporter [Chloroflexota bacterium]|nr:MFS transporter [Chloroflexota bacterium]